jgi:arylsulfatase
VEAAKSNVLPLDWRASERFNSEAMGRPSLTRGRTSMTYFPGTIGVPDAASPSMINKSWTITADIELTDDKTSGMVITHGGLEGGYGLYLRDGVPTFAYNFLGTDRISIAAQEALPKGKVKLAVDFKYDGGGVGKGGAITVTADDRIVAEGRLEKTIPVQFSLGEGLDVGMDVGSAVDFTYQLPFAFTGRIEKVNVQLEK